MASANPFDDNRSQHDLNANPFESSSNRNPFEHANDSAFSLDSQDTARGVGGAPPAPAPVPVPAASSGWGLGGWGGSAPATAGGGDISAREAALNAREQALREREEALGMKENNWPKFFPFCRHSITDLPEDHRPIMKFLYTQWLANAATLLINLLGCIFLLVAGSSEGGADTGGAGGYLLFILPLSFITWYRPIYLGFSRTEGKAMAFFFYLYFIFAGFHLAFSTYMAIGIPSTGSAGLINTIAMLSQGHILAGVFGVIASVGWLFQAIGGGLLYKKVWDYKNNNADITFAEATASFKSNSIKTVLLHQARM